MTLTVEWHDGGREPRHPPDRRYPEGVDLDVSHGNLRTCETKLPYPAARCGTFSVHCTECGYLAVVTTAGRIDDPRSIRVPCKPKPLP